MFGIWLPKGYAETELRMEKTGERTSPRVLTRRGSFGYASGIGTRAAAVAPQEERKRLENLGRFVFSAMLTCPPGPEFPIGY